jgi:hypothetical protein
MWRRALFVLAGLSSLACAAAGPPTRHAASGVRRDIITATEIVAARVTDAYQAVIQLRPEFLRRRGGVPTSASMIRSNIVVYLDELPYGSLESLRYIPLDRVRIIRYVSPTDADLRWGGSHPTGAILVTTLLR